LFRIEQGRTIYWQGNRILIGNKKLRREFRELNENNNGKTGTRQRNNTLRENGKERAFSFFAVFASGSFLAVSGESVFLLRVIRVIRGQSFFCWQQDAIALKRPHSGVDLGAKIRNIVQTNRR
jgi:hypothetical protein